MRKTKKWFLEELRSHLSSLPDEEVDDIMSDYEEHFAMAKKKKRKDTEIIKALGEPKALAKQLVAESHVKKAKENPSFKNVGRAVLATIGLGFFNIIFILGPYVGLLAVILSLFVTGVALAASGLAVMLAGAAVPAILGSSLAAIGVLAVVFTGLALLSFGILFTIGCTYLAKYFFKATAWYLRLNVRVIKGRGDDS